MNSFRFLVTFILLCSLVACSSTSKRYIASDERIELSQVDKDLLVLEGGLKRLDYLMGTFDEKIRPLILKTEKKKYSELSNAENADIDEFWTNYMNMKIMFHLLQEAYKNNKDFEQEDQQKIAYIRYLSQLALLSTGSEIVHSVWDNKFMRKKLDMSNLREIPEGSFYSLQNEVFKRVNKKLKLHDKEEQELFPSADFEEALANISATLNENEEESPILTRLTNIAPRFENLLEKHRSFLASSKMHFIQKKRNLAYNFRKHVYDPIFIKIATWFGDTKVKHRNPKLHYGNAAITHEKALAFTSKLSPGDFILSRGNWYLSNAFLPGFWPHAIIYTGEVDQFSDFFNSDEETKRFYQERCEKEDLPCSNFTEYLAVAPETKKAWENYNQKDQHGESRIILEAVSEGIVFSSAYNIMSDYLAGIRPKISTLEKAKSIEKGFDKFGIPYDFDFDWTTDDKIVCSELLTKSYKPEPREGKSGLTFDYDFEKQQYYTITAGHYALPPTQFVVKAYDENVSKIRPSEFDFIAFMKNNPKTNIPDFSDEQTFYESRLFPKWSFMQK